MTVDEFFDGWEGSRRIFDHLCDVREAVGMAQMRVTKSQVAFYRRRAFAWAWIQGRQGEP